MADLDLGHPAMDEYRTRVAACADRKSKSPSHIEELRTAVVRELEADADGRIMQPGNLLLAIERYDAAKGGPHV